MRIFLRYGFLFLLPLSILPLMIGWIDPMGLFREDFSKQMIEPNQHFIKMRWLLTEKRPYDSFLFGSSKAGNIDTRHLEGGNWYNMTYSMGVPAEWVQDLERLLEAGYKVRNLVVCLDEFSYIRESSQNNSLLRTTYPVTAWAEYKFLAGYLLRFPNFKVLKEATPAFNSLGEYRVAYDLFDSGIPFKAAREAYIDTHLEVHTRDSRFDIEWPHRIPQPEESLQALARLQLLCQQQDIKLRVIYLPVFEKKLARVKENGFDSYKAAVAEIVPYLDFSEAPSIIHDRKLWFEQIHFRRRVGDLIVRRLNGEAELAHFGLLQKPGKLVNVN